MKKYRYWILFAAIIAIFIWFKGCGSQEPPKMTPEVKGESNSTPPVQETIPDSIVYKYVYLPAKEGKAQPVLNDSDSLLRDIALENIALQKAFDSLSAEKKNTKFAERLRPKRFVKKFEDENVTIKDSGIVVGEIKSSKITYVWKSKPTPPEKRHYFIGGGLGSDIKFENPTAKAKFTMQDKKGNLQGISIDNRKTLMLEYDIKVW